MCNPMAIAATSAGLQILGNYTSQKSTADSYQEQMDARKQSAVHNMNYMFQNYEQERQDAFDVTVNKLDELKRSSMGLNGKIEAATNEQMQGRTANLINRVATGDTARTETSLKDNYDRKSNEIDLNKESKLLETEDYINNLNASAPKMPSRFSNFLSSAGIILNAYTQGADETQRRQNVLGGSTKGTNIGSLSYSGGGYASGLQPLKLNYNSPYTINYKG